MSVDPGEDKVLLGHPYNIDGVDKVGTWNPYAITPAPGTSRITTGFTALISLMTTTFPTADGWSRLPNPYKPEENPEPFLRQGWGVSLGPAVSENLQICAQYDLNRSMVITLARKYEGTENDDAGKASSEIQLLEDQRRLINVLEQNASLTGTIMYTQYQGDDGLEYVRGETDRFLMIRTTVSFQYIESFV